MKRARRHSPCASDSEQHRANPSCNGCHGVIDPLGFALENYDVTGAWRDVDRDAGDKIDASGKLASGQHVGGPSELNQALLARPDQFVQALTEKLHDVRARSRPALSGHAVGARYRARRRQRRLPLRVAHPRHRREPSGSR